jgi:hypothetical protein
MTDDDLILVSRADIRAASLARSALDEDVYRALCVALAGPAVSRSDLRAALAANGTIPDDVYDRLAAAAGEAR